MASASGNSADTEEDMDTSDFELFECCICLEILIKKQPRLLHCGHTFCTPCLHQIIRKDEIICPKCRSVTRVPPGGVEGLPKNSDLRKVWDREQEMNSLVRGRGDQSCNMCKRFSKAEYICTSCPVRIICKNCADLHKTIPILIPHTVVKLQALKTAATVHCEEHNLPMEYFCSFCEEGLCVMCLGAGKHAQHNAKVLDYQKGIEEFKKSTKVKEIESSLKEHAMKLRMCDDLVQAEIKNIHKTEDTLYEEYQELQALLNKKKIQLDSVTNLDLPLSHVQEQANEHCKQVIEQLDIIDRIFKLPEENVVCKIKEWHKKSQDVLMGTNEIFNLKYSKPKMDGLEKTKSYHNVEIQEAALTDEVEAKFKEWKENPPQRNSPVFISQVAFRMRFDGFVPTELIKVGDGSVILVDQGLRYVRRLNMAGVITDIYPSLFKRSTIKSACVYGKYLFIVSSNRWVTKTLLADAEWKTKTELRGIQADYITAIGENTLLVTISKDKGGIVEYNLDTHVCRTRLSDIKQPGKVCVAMDGDKMKFIVRCLKPKDNIPSNNPVYKVCIKIYDDNWKEETTIETPNQWDPQGLTVASSHEQIIVTDRSKACLFAYRLLNGEYHGNALYMPNRITLNGSLDVVYHYPRVWVLETDKCLSLFKVGTNQSSNKPEDTVNVLKRGLCST